MKEEEIIAYLKLKVNITKKQIEDGSLFLYVEDTKKEIEAIQSLLDLYEKEKEKNKLTGNDIENFKREAYMLGKADENKAMIGVIQRHYISKDKIREKIENKIAYCRAEELEDRYIGDKHSQYWGMYRELLEKLEKQLLEEE